MKWHRENGSKASILVPLRISLPYLEKLASKDADRDAAWELYIELLTRITTQPLPQEHGDEETALKSVYARFRPDSRHDQTPRAGVPGIHQAGHRRAESDRAALYAKWHRLSLHGGFDDAARCAEFRDELEQLQGKLREYTRMLGAMADVKDLTHLEADIDQSPLATDTRFGPRDLPTLIDGPPGRQSY